jgi:hypothetical protein
MQLGDVTTLTELKLICRIQDILATNMRERQRSLMPCLVKIHQCPLNDRMGVSAETVCDGLGISESLLRPVSVLYMTLPINNEEIQTIVYVNYR